MTKLRQQAACHYQNQACELTLTITLKATRAFFLMAPHQKRNKIYFLLSSNQNCLSGSCVCYEFGMKHSITLKQKHCFILKKKGGSNVIKNLMLSVTTSKQNHLVICSRYSEVADINNTFASGCPIHLCVVFTLLKTEAIYLFPKVV